MVERDHVTSILASDWSGMHPVAGHDVMMGSKVGGNARNGHETRMMGSLGTSGALCDQPQVIVGLSPGVTTYIGGPWDLATELGSPARLGVWGGGTEICSTLCNDQLAAPERLQPTAGVSVSFG